MIDETPLYKGLPNLPVKPTESEIMIHWKWETPEAFFSPEEMRMLDELRKREAEDSERKEIDESLEATDDPSR